MTAPHSGSLPGSLPFPLGGSLVTYATSGDASEIGRNLNGQVRDLMARDSERVEPGASERGERS